jgi:hypothetical protein
MQFWNWSTNASAKKNTNLETLKNYTVILRKSSTDEQSIQNFKAKDDDEAKLFLKEHLEGTRVLYDGSKSIGYGWKVSSLVSEEDENIWKETNSQTGGSRKRLTKEKVIVGKKSKCVYVGPKGGRYVKSANGKFVSV